MKKILLWGGLIIFLVVLAVSLFRSQQGQVNTGEPAPDFELISFSGEKYQLSDLRGNVVLINFWASWCESCKPEAKDLEDAYQFYLSREDVVFLGIDYVDTEPEALAYLEEFGVTYPNGPDLQTKISQAYRIRGVPETFIIDKNGTIAFVKIGPFQSLAEILSIIDPLLN